MQAASASYKSEMKQPLRNRSYMRVTLGVINQEAQRTAYASTTGAYAYFSNLNKPFENYKVDYLYATAERNYSVADGSMVFLPRNIDEVILNAGIVTEELLGSIEINFDIAYDIKGLTIEFGKSYPVSFTIESDHNIVTISDNTSGSFITDEVFLQATYIRIIPTVMINSQGRLRIHQITMGVGIFFDNRKVLSSTLKDTKSPISEELPALDFDMTVDNKDKSYNVENKKSSINFLETGQECIVQYGYELNDGSIEWIPGAKLFLKSWSADDAQMKCSAVDRFEYMQGSYYKGTFYTEGISLYNLALDVLTDAGIDPRDYWLDGYLKDIMVYNPIPVCSHKEALQIIANAGRCILSQDREAKIFIKASFAPDMTASSSNATAFSNTGNILTEGTKNTYATGSNDTIAADGNSFFLPRTGSYLNTGYVSQAVSGATGLFTANPTVTVNLEASFKCFSLTVLFNGNPPNEFVIHTYLEGISVEDVIITEIDSETWISREFSEFDKMVLEFTKAPAYNRIMVDCIEFGEVTDYILEKSMDLSKIPVGTKLEKVKELQLIRTLYNSSGEIKELLSETVTVSSANNVFIFEFSNASYGYTCTLEGALPGQSVSLLESGSYYVKVAFNGFIVENDANLKVTGYEFAITTAKVTQTLNTTGSTATWANPLISALNHAKDVAEWIGSYLQADREYDISYRGDPRIDSNDIVFMENDYINEMQIRISEHTLNFNGTLSGTMKARRVVDVG